MVTDHRSHRDAVESPPWRIFTFHLDTALENLLQVMQLDPGHRVISKGHLLLQPICFCKNKELQCPVMHHQAEYAAMLWFWVSQEVTWLQNITCPMQQMGHAALPIRAGVKRLRDTACTFAGHTKRGIPHLNAG